MNPKKAKTKTAGVYRIDINGCYYFGSAVDLEVRRRNHLRLLKKGKHSNAYIQKFYNEGHKLKFKIVETCHREYVKFLEQTYLDAHHGKPKCLNIQPGAGVYLPVTLRRETVWNGVTYASRTEWALATGYSRGSYSQFVRRGILSDQQRIEVSAKNYSKARRKYWTDEEKQNAKRMNWQKSIEKKRHERSQMIDKSCKLAVYFNGRYWESIRALSLDCGHTEYSLNKYIKIGARSNLDLQMMMREERKKMGHHSSGSKVRSPIVVNFDGNKCVFPSYLKAAEAFDLYKGPCTKTEIRERLQRAGFEVKPISKEEYYERQSKRAV
jgi:hypothetical protein